MVLLVSVVAATVLVLAVAGWAWRRGVDDLRRSREARRDDAHWGDWPPDSMGL